MAIASLIGVFGSLTAAQGQALELSIPTRPDLKAAHVVWDDRQVPLTPDGERWLTVIGIDLDKDPGEYSASITFELESGETHTETEQITVRARTFPTTALTVDGRYVELSAADQARAEREGREILDLYATLTPERYWSEPFRVPLEGVSEGRNFGHRRVFNGEPRAPHSGADLRARLGTPVHAANRGRVVMAEDLFFGGNSVFIDHGLGMYSVYMHLSEMQVTPGTMVEKGQVIGLAGATGRVTGPHLHWGVRILDARIDPFTLLQIRAE